MDTEIYDKAHAILAKRREDAQAENDRRIREINEKIPEIKEINNTLFNTGREFLSIIANNRGKDLSAEIERVKRTNLGAQDAAKQHLVSHGYPPDYLDIHYSCPKCNDTGYIDSEFCDCMKNLFGRLMTEKLNENAHLTLSSFDTFSLKYYDGDDYFTMQRILNFTREYAMNFNRNAGNILMTGETGLGKTHLSLAIANTVLQKGYSVLYDSAINILWNIEREHFSYEHSSDFLNAIFDADLLIIDDLGTEQETKFYSSMVYNIINTRLVRNKPTIISTNMNHNEITSRYGKRISSRVATMYTGLKFAGKDVRSQKALQNK